MYQLTFLCTKIIIKAQKTWWSTFKHKGPTYSSESAFGLSRNSFKATFHDLNLTTKPAWQSLVTQWKRSSWSHIHRLVPSVVPFVLSGDTETNWRWYRWWVTARQQTPEPEDKINMNMWYLLNKYLWSTGIDASDQCQHLNICTATAPLTQQ